MSAGTGPAPAKRRRRGPRPKHVPQRTCIACRDKSAKRTLTRVVRTPEGVVEIDPTGKRNGRGAYLCDRATCWERALSTNALAHALEIEIAAETATTLRAYAAGLTPVDEAATAAEEGLPA